MIETCARKSDSQASTGLLVGIIGPPTSSSRQLPSSVLASTSSNGIRRDERAGLPESLEIYAENSPRDAIPAAQRRSGDCAFG
ncbi:hypothetical protein ACFPRL_15415 [Pseudoclavibacter helvolus]